MTHHPVTTTEVDGIRERSRGRIEMLTLDRYAVMIDGAALSAQDLRRLADWVDQERAIPVREHCHPHPEMLHAETFITNTTLKDFEYVGWRTKRMGQHAYCIKGELIHGMRPVFVKTSELEAAGNSGEAT